MPYPLNNITSQDNYNDFSTTLVPPRPVHKATITIANAAVFVRLERCNGVRVGAGVFLPEEFWIPGVYGITREFPFGRIQFRSAVLGKPAQITANVAGS